MRKKERMALSKRLRSSNSLVRSNVGSISSRCSGKEPVFLPRTQTSERAAEIEPSSNVLRREIRNQIIKK